MQMLLAPFTAAVVSGLLVISYLVPADAKTVYLGEALPQNLFWLLAGILASLASVYHRGFAIEFKSIDWCLLTAGSLWLILSCIFADRFGNGRAAFNGFWQVASLGSCYAIVSVLGRIPQFAKTIVALLLVCGLAMSIHGIHQVAISFPRDRVEYTRNPDSVLKSQGIDAPEGSMMRMRFEDRLLRSNEPFATFALANSLATVLAATLLLFTGVVLSSITQLSGSTSRRAKGHGKLISSTQAVEQPDSRYRMSGLVTARVMILAIMCLLVAACWILTKSRASIVAVASAGCVWLVLTALVRGDRLLSRASRYGLTAMVLMILAGLAWMLSTDRLVMSEAIKSLSFRMEYWQASWRLIQDHWIWGVGLGNFQSYYPQYKLVTASEIIADPHNWVLDLAATASLPVTGLIVVWLLRIILFSGRLGRYWTSTSSTDVGQAGPTKCEPMKSEPMKSEPMKSEPMKSEPMALATGALDVSNTAPEASAYGSPEASAYGSPEASACGSRAPETVPDGGITGTRIKRAALLGAAVGWIGCVGLMTLTGQGFDWEAGSIAWVISALCLWLLFDWIERGSLADNAVLASIVAMVICLLASGSWQASGVGIPLMCLLGIRRSGNARLTFGNRITAEQGVIAQHSDKRVGSTKRENWQVWLPAAMATLGLVIFMFHTWRPTTESWTLQQQSVRALRIGEQIELAQQAAAADSLDPVPLVTILQLQSASLKELRDVSEFPRRLESIDRSIDELLKSDSASHLNWQLAGNTLLDAAGIGQKNSIQNQELFTRAAKLYAEASRRYPGSVQLRVQYATALAAVGDWQGCKKEVDEAFRLSDLTPHADQKLENQQIWLPIVPLEIPQSEIVRPTGGPEWAKAEPVAWWLRSR